jgi:hypothetical protein
MNKQTDKRMDKQTDKTDEQAKMKLDKEMGSQIYGCKTISVRD